MSAPNSLEEKSQGSFASQIELQRNNKHAPGVMVGNDAVPEFHVQILPAGSAPVDRTFKPNVGPETDVPGASHPDTGKETHVSAADTVVGATSADVHTGYGKPGQGQTSSELHNDNLGSKDGGMLTNSRDGAVDEDDLSSEHRKGGKANASTVEEKDDIIGAEEREPQTAESVAAELD